LTLRGRSAMPAKSKKAAKSKKGGAQTSRGPEKKEEPKLNTSQILPAKENLLFKTILRCYETKAYKKGLKAADKVLETFPLHGETLAMKGLTMNCLNKKDEATALVKKGLAMNIKSHVCWHVFGLLYRSEQKYDDAIKCYQNALRIDTENSQILKDLALLQIQRRMHDGFQETRRKILMLKTNNTSNWIAYAIGNHLNGNYPKALSVLDTYIKTLDKKVNYENSELFLYYNMVIEESGDFERALTHLDEIEKNVVDKLSLREIRGKLNLKLGNFGKAQEDFEKLVKLNPENYDYHLLVMQAKQILTSAAFPSSYTDEQIQVCDQLYTELASQHERCAAVTRIPLNFLKGAAFKERADKYLRERLRRGIPSLYRDMSSLYTDPDKVKIITELLEGYLKCLRSDSKFSPDGELEAPSAYIWALYYLGHHHDHLGQTEAALKATDEAIAHTPTNVDLYVLKARIFKHAHSHTLAHQYMNQARLMDTADRYLNTKCTRYCWRKNSQQEAEDTVSLFLRDGDNLNSLKDMQCSWYENSAGKSFTRQKNWGKALKNYLAVSEHFHTIEEDQSDFHSYCLRKMTIRAYIRMMRMEDQIRSHRFFFKAAEGAVQVYLNLWNLTHKPKTSSETDTKEISAVEQKRLDKKAKREQAKAARAAAENASKEAAQNKEKSESDQKKDAVKDDDPDGVALAQTKEPLEEATKLLKDLLLYSTGRISTHLLAVEVYVNKQKYLLALRSLKTALSLAPNDPGVHYARTLFLAAVSKADGLSEYVSKVIQAERESTISTKAPEELNNEYLAANKDSLAHCTAVSKSKFLLDGTASVAAGDLIVKCPITSSTTSEDCIAALEFLTDISHPGVNDFQSRCSAKFPYTPVFISSGDETNAYFEKYSLVEPLASCQIHNQN